MSNETIALLNLIWYICCSLAAAAWVVVPTFSRYIKPWWQDWRYRKLVHGEQPRASILIRLIKLLGKVQAQLSFAQNEVVVDIQRDLGRVTWSVWTEALPYLDIFSSSEKKRSSAIRNLSQTADDKSMERAIEIISGIANHPWTSRKVKKVANAALEELEERQKIMKK